MRPVFVYYKNTRSVFILNLTLTGPGDCVGRRGKAARPEQNEGVGKFVVALASQLHQF